MNPISKTAYFCCGARMLDAESSRPTCGDTYAKDFMDKQGLEVFENFRHLKNAIIANAVRHRIIDDLIRTELMKDTQTTIILIGSGFDTRAYRLDGGSWIELDEPQLMMHKNKCLSVSKCRNPLQRIPTDIITDPLNEKLSAIKPDTPPIVIIEGVFIYLTEEEINKLIHSVQTCFPCHTLICDLQTYSFFRQFNTQYQKVVQEIGTPLKIYSDYPEQVFVNSGYRIRQRISIIEKTFEYAKLTIKQTLIKILMRTVFRKIKDGYSIYTFEFDNHCIDDK